MNRRNFLQLISAAVISPVMPLAAEPLTPTQVIGMIKKRALMFAPLGSYAQAIRENGWKAGNIFPVSNISRCRCGKCVDCWWNEATEDSLIDTLAELSLIK